MRTCIVCKRSSQVYWTPSHTRARTLAPCLLTPLQFGNDQRAWEHSRGKDSSCSFSIAQRLQPNASHPITSQLLVRLCLMVPADGATPVPCLVVGALENCADVRSNTRGHVWRSRTSQQRLLLLLSCLQSHDQTEATPDPQPGPRDHKTLWHRHRGREWSPVLQSAARGRRCVSGARRCETHFTHEDPDAEGADHPVPLVPFHPPGRLPVVQLPLWLWHGEAGQKEYRRGFTVSGEGTRCRAVREHGRAVLPEEVAPEEGAADQLSRLRGVEIRGKVSSGE